MAADAINDIPSSGTASRSKCGFAVINMPQTFTLPRNPTKEISRRSISVPDALAAPEAQKARI
jgi:hypothetical protein